MKRQGLSPDNFRRVRDFIYEQCGIYFQDNKSYLLEDRLKRRLKARNISTYDEYIYFLRYDPQREREIRELFNAITTRETSFFRDMKQLEIFKNKILPEIMERKKDGNKVINLWSAGCSTGEEPYSLAMILVETGMHLKGWRIEILASDLSEQALAFAQKAMYRDHTMRNVPHRYLNRYFVKGVDSHSVRKEIKQLVTFKKINLLDPLIMRYIKGMDVIFCRNVFIYFDNNVRKKVINYFYDSLVDGGFLIVGSSESLFRVTERFRSVNIDRYVVYQKI